MARRRKPGRKQKSGPRTKSGRLSRAYKNPEVRDQGTREFQDKRQYLVNGADPRSPPPPAASCSPTAPDPGAVYAHYRYAWAHALSLGKPWRQICPLGEPVGSEPPSADAGDRARQAGVDGAAARPRPTQGSRRRRGVRLPADVVDRRPSSGCGRCRKTRTTARRCSAGSTRWPGDLPRRLLEQACPGNGLGRSAAQPIDLSPHVAAVPALGVGLREVAQASGATLQPTRGQTYHHAAHGDR